MKHVFNPGVAFPIIEKAIAPFPQAGLSQLMDEGHTTAFEQLVACIISIRTLDETMLPIARRLFEIAPTPQAIKNHTPEAIAKIIYGCGFHTNKARQIHTIASRVVDEFDGVLPCDPAVILSMPGVGPKCANLVLSIACGQPFIGVDIHVHRISNRWGYVATRTPEQTLAALEAKLPVEYWHEINKLLVPFGKNICTPTAPKCSICPLREMCAQVGVTRHR